MTLTVDLDDRAALLLQLEAQRSGESLAERASHLLSVTLENHPPTLPIPKRFEVKPFELGTREQWERWQGMNADEILDELRGAMRP